VFGLVALVWLAGGVLLLLVLCGLLFLLYFLLRKFSTRAAALTITIVAGLALYLAPSYPEIRDVAALRSRCPSPNSTIYRTVSPVDTIRVSGTQWRWFNFGVWQYRAYEFVDDRGALMVYDVSRRGECQGLGLCPATEFRSLYEVHWDVNEGREDNLDSSMIVIRKVDTGEILAKGEWHNRRNGHDFPWDAGFLPWRLWKLAYHAPEQCTDTLAIQPFIYSVLVPAVPSDPGAAQRSR
jgi:hypothetical protein